MLCLVNNSLPASYGITHPFNSSRSFISSRHSGQEDFWDGDPHPTPQEPSSGHGVFQVRSRDPYTPRMAAKQVKYPLIQALGCRNGAKWKWEKGRTSTSCVFFYCVFLQLNEAGWEICAGNRERMDTGLIYGLFTNRQSKCSSK